MSAADIQHVPPNAMPGWRQAAGGTKADIYSCRTCSCINVYQILAFQPCGGLPTANLSCPLPRALRPALQPARRRGSSIVVINQVRLAVVSWQHDGHAVSHREGEHPRGVICGAEAPTAPVFRPQSSICTRSGTRASMGGAGWQGVLQDGAAACAASVAGVLAVSYTPCRRSLLVPLRCRQTFWPS